MTHSPTPTELLALKTANAALLESRDTFCDMVATVVFALGSAQLLQSPETAAELSRLRLIQNAQPAELSEAQIDALADAGNQALNDHYHDDLCHCSDWPESCASSGNYFAGSWDTAAFGIGMAAVIGVWESMRAPAETAELSRLRTRVAELEAKHPKPLPDAQCFTCGEGLDDENITDFCSDQCVAVDARRDASVEKLRALLADQREDRYVSPLHQEHKVPHDLPEVPRG